MASKKELKKRLGESNKSVEILGQSFLGISGYRMMMILMACVYVKVLLMDLSMPVTLFATWFMAQPVIMNPNNVIATAHRNEALNNYNIWDEYGTEALENLASFLTISLALYFYVILGFQPTWVKLLSAPLLWVGVLILKDGVKNCFKSYIFKYPKRLVRGIKNDVSEVMKPTYDNLGDKFSALLMLLNLVAVIVLSATIVPVAIDLWYAASAAEAVYSTLALEYACRATQAVTIANLICTPTPRHMAYASKSGTRFEMKPFGTQDDEEWKVISTADMKPV